MRPGDVKLLMRHYSVAQNPLELGFFGAEAAAEQGYGWQYTYLFFRNQDEAERFGVDDEFMESLAGSIGELDMPEWKRTSSRERRTDGAIARAARGLRRARHRASASAPSRRRSSAARSGTRTLQDGPTLAQIEAAIEASAAAPPLV